MTRDKKRIIVVEIKAIIEADNDAELFEYTAQTIREMEESLCGYSGLEKFKVYERRKKK